MNQSNHTPVLPLVADGREILDARGSHVAIAQLGSGCCAGSYDEANANAALIVKAVNAHQKLVDALISLSKDATYLAGRGFVGGKKREDVERATLQTVDAVRALLAELEGK